MVWVIFFLRAWQGVTLLRIQEKEGSLPKGARNQVPSVVLALQVSLSHQKSSVSGHVKGAEAGCCSAIFSSPFLS